MLGTRALTISTLGRRATHSKQQWRRIEYLMPPGLGKYRCRGGARHCGAGGKRKGGAGEDAVETAEV
jgi:hypothetical protein